MAKVRSRKEGYQSHKRSRNSTQHIMETRTRSRAAEELITMEGKDRDMKGKAVMEVAKEILEIYDDSEEEEDRRETTKKNKEYG